MEFAGKARDATIRPATLDSTACFMAIGLGLVLLLIVACVLL
jgi:hypothetical protein